MPATDDEVSLREIVRNLADFRAEFRGVIGQLVRADVYRAEMLAYEQRVATLEKDRDAAEQSRAATHRLAIGAMLTGLVSVIGGLILFTITHH